jgi:hypothetical protein
MARHEGDKGNSSAAMSGFCKNQIYLSVRDNWAKGAKGDDSELKLISKEINPSVS